jgi:hypothetical protein
MMCHYFPLFPFFSPYLFCIFLFAEECTTISNVFLNQNGQRVETKDVYVDDHPGPTRLPESNLRSLPAAAFPRRIPAG